MSSLEIHDEVNVRATSLPGAERVLHEDTFCFVARLHHEFGPRRHRVLRRRDERLDHLRGDAISRFLAEHELYAPARESYEWQAGEEPQLKQQDREDARVSARDQMDVRIDDSRATHAGVALDRVVFDDDLVPFLDRPGDVDLG